jgi:hypothetical protein
MPQTIDDVGLIPAFELAWRLYDEYSTTLESLNTRAGIGIGFLGTVVAVITSSFDVHALGGIPIAVVRWLYGGVFILAVAALLMLVWALVPKPTHWGANTLRLRDTDWMLDRVDL